MEALFIAVFYTISVILMMIGLSFGAVKIPERLRRFANPKDLQSFCEFEIGKNKQKIRENYYNLELECKVVPRNMFFDRFSSFF